MANPYIGQISPFAFPFAPLGWTFCNGGTAPINQYGSLFALLGTAFGGNGSTTLGLPNLNGVSPCGTGQGPGLTQRQLGQSFGSISVTLDVGSMGPHTHGGQAIELGRGESATGTPGSDYGLAATANIDTYASGAPNSAMAPTAISFNGGGGAHNNMQPYLTLNYCLALLGTYPYFS